MFQINFAEFQADFAHIDPLEEHPWGVKVRGIDIHQASSWSSATWSLVNKILKDLHCVVFLCDENNSTTHKSQCEHCEHSHTYTSPLLDRLVLKYKHSIINDNDEDPTLSVLCDELKRYLEFQVALERKALGVSHKPTSPIPQYSHLNWTPDAFGVLHFLFR